MLYVFAASGLLCVSIIVVAATVRRTARAAAGVSSVKLDAFGWTFFFFIVATLAFICSLLPSAVSTIGFSGVGAVYVATAFAQIGLALCSLLFAKVCKSKIGLDVSAFSIKEGVKYFFTTLSALLFGAGIGLFYKFFTGETPVRQAAIDIFLDSDGATRVIALISVALFAPIAEELFFRGTLYPVLKGFFERKFPSLKGSAAAISAAIAASAMFSAIHAEIFAALPLFLVGLILTCAYERTGSIATPVVAHSLFNIVNIAVISASEICVRS